MGGRGFTPTTLDSHLMVPSSHYLHTFATILVVSLSSLRQTANRISSTTPPIPPNTHTHTQTDKARPKRFFQLRGSTTTDFHFCWAK